MSIRARAPAEDRVELLRLAQEQAALRRLATLVARGVPSDEVFNAVAQQVAEVMHIPMVAVCRYEDDGAAARVVAAVSDRAHLFQPGSLWPLDGPSVIEQVLRTRRAARREDYDGLRGALAAAARQGGHTRIAGAPIVVAGRVWGVIVVASPDAPIPEELEDRLAEFTELTAAAISSGQAREDLRRIAEEQTALRRVATLVAEGAPPAEVFEAVSVEVAQLVPAEGSALMRFDADDALTVLGGWSDVGGYAYVGRSFPLEGTVSGIVLESRRAGRIDSFADVPGPAAAAARELGWRSAVGAPITVEGRIWGVLAVVSKGARPLPPDTERRLADFTELVATAIANAASRAELEASRARVVATADATRRRIERDLHDRAQQRLVSLALELRAAQAGVPPELGEHRAELSRVVDGLTGALDELREIALGIHPATLVESGLGPAVRELVRGSPTPVQLDVRVETRLPEHAEVAAYYVVSEALTNAAKYAQASIVNVALEVRDDVLRVSILDDGVGGADPARGSGLLGLKDRAEASGGTISLQSPPEAGTSVRVELPLDN